MSKNDKISDLFSKKSPLLSFEVYPPKTDEGVKNLLVHLQKLEKFHPDYISVTYGAGGGNQNKSLEVLESVHKHFEGAVVAHFTCVGLDKDNINDFVHRLEKMDVKNILALRGDPPKDNPHFDFSKNYFKYASELVAYIKKATRLCVGVAGYPEGHVQSPTREADWDNLKRKVDAGAEYVITQLFFDNRDFYEFRDGMEARGVKVPLIPGILPVPSIERLKKSINLSGTKISAEYNQIVEKYTDLPDSFRKASQDYFKCQVRDLIKNEAPGIHYYILNSSEFISEILETL